MASHTVPSHSAGRARRTPAPSSRWPPSFSEFLVAVLGLFALLMWADARKSDNATEVAVTAAEPAAPKLGHRAGSQAADHNTALPLDSFAGVVPENAAELAEAHARDGRCPSAGPGRQPGQGGDDPQGHGRRGGAGREVQHLGLRRPRRARARHPRPRRADGRDDARERRLDPALDRLPRGADRTQRRLQGRRPRRVLHVPLQGRRPRRLHVPLRDQAGARPHRQRHVRRDRGRSREAAAEGRQRVRAGRQRVVPRQRRHLRSRRA